MFRKILLVILLLLVPSVAFSAPEKHGVALVFKTTGEFADVKEELLDAIMERGMVISFTAYVKAMLDRTGKAVGVKDNVYLHGETLLLCKAGLSHKLAKENPHQIVLCPWKISIYSLKKDPKTIYLSTRRPYKEEKAYLEVHKLLQEIILQAIDN